MLDQQTLNYCLAGTVLFAIFYKICEPWYRSFFMMSFTRKGRPLDPRDVKVSDVFSFFWRIAKAIGGAIWSFFFGPPKYSDHRL